MGTCGHSGAMGGREGRAQRSGHEGLYGPLPRALRRFHSPSSHPERQQAAEVGGQEWGGGRGRRHRAGSPGSSGLSLSQARGEVKGARKGGGGPPQLWSQYGLSLLTLSFPQRGSICGLKTSQHQQNPHYVPNIPIMWSLQGLRGALILAK